MTDHKLDLRGVACPMNFVKTKLFMDKLQVDEVVTVWLDPGEPVDSVCSSIEAEGHAVESCCEKSGHFSVKIRKLPTMPGLC